jgi:PhnB protein
MTAQKTLTLQPIPYLAFDGTCAEAMKFYEETLGGTIKLMMKASDSPMADQVPEKHKDMILNCQLELPGGVWLYGSDCPPHMEYQGHHGFSLTLNLTEVDEAEKIFNKLADGGRITMPFEPTFWAEKFGMVEDKFGIDWIINGAMKRM